MRLTPAQVSLCMINRDGARWLPGGMGRLAGQVGQIVMADTGSEDDSIAVARGFGAEVIRIPWTDDFSEARNAALARAARPWVLSLDSDEVLFPEDLAEMCRHVRQDERVGVRVVTRHYEDDNGCEGWRPCRPDPRLGIATQGCRQTRNVKLFPRDEAVKYVYPVHETVAPSLQAAGFTIRDALIAVHHLGHATASPATAAAKVQRNLRLGLKKIRQFPDCAAGFLELGELVLTHGKAEMALRLFRRALELDPSRSRAYVRLAQAYARQGQRDGAPPIEAALRAAANVASASGPEA